MSGEPSDRELANWGHTREEWDSNAVVDGGEGPAPIRSLDLISDDHYESQESYRVALAIVEALKTLEPTFGR